MKRHCDAHPARSGVCIILQHSTQFNMQWVGMVSTTGYANRRTGSVSACITTTYIDTLTPSPGVKGSVPGTGCQHSRSPAGLTCIRLGKLGKARQEAILSCVECVSWGGGGRSEGRGRISAGRVPHTVPQISQFLQLTQIT